MAQRMKDAFLGQAGKAVAVTPECRINSMLIAGTTGIVTPVILNWLGGFFVVSGLAKPVALFSGCDGNFVAPKCG